MLLQTLEDWLFEVRHVLAHLMLQPPSVPCVRRKPISTQFNDLQDSYRRSEDHRQ